MIDAKILKELKKRPHYAYLYAKNILKRRLPKEVEKVFCKDPESAYLYAKNILKAPLPNFIHNALIISSFESDFSKHFVSLYIKEFC